jgi:ATP phosphoribosyltransferase regulatory subunit
LRQQASELPAEVRAALLALTRLNGGREVLDEARRRLPTSAAISAALDELEAIIRSLNADDVSIDLSDLHGYRYKTGVTFTVHTEGSSNEVLRGGRYDDIGKAFGRARPAVGFSIYLRELAELAVDDPPRAILAPADSDLPLRELIAQLRRQGEIVVQRLEGESDRVEESDFIFDRVIKRQGQTWEVVSRQGNE